MLLLISVGLLHVEVVFIHPLQSFLLLCLSLLLCHLQLVLMLNYSAPLVEHFLLLYDRQVALQCVSTGSLQLDIMFDRLLKVNLGDGVASTDNQVAWVLKFFEAVAILRHLL